MILLSRLSDYAIVLMCAMAESKDEIFSSRKLHESTHISHSAIMKILKLLTSGGLVTSVRGAKGGYSVTSEPKEISILDIVKAIDGPISITLCSHKRKDNPCIFEPHCTAKRGWIMVNDALQDTLFRFTIADFIVAHTESNNKGLQDDFKT